MKNFKFLMVLGMVIAIGVSAFAEENVPAEEEIFGVEELEEAKAVIRQQQVDLAIEKGYIVTFPGDKTRYGEKELIESLAEQKKKSAASKSMGAAYTAEQMSGRNRTQVPWLVTSDIIENDAKELLRKARAEEISKKGAMTEKDGSEEEKNVTSPAKNVKKIKKSLKPLLTS